MPILRVDGREVPLAEGDEDRSLLEVLRLRAGVTSAKDGCAPQGQCGCCTVLVDGQPRVACVTATRRVIDREITTVDGLADGAQWADAFTAAGASQCGFCTPGIIVRLASLSDRSRASDALLAHLCRCTGWRTILDAVDEFGSAASSPRRDVDAAAARAALEGRTPQVVGPSVALGRAGFADDSAPSDCLIAVLDGRGEWVVAETLSEARAAAGKVQGRRTTLPLGWPVEVPAGEWALTLQTTWVEPAYLEPDCSWCEPGGEPYTPLANGGAFGGKVASPVADAARRLADQHGRAVKVVLSREDTVRLGPKRPPIGAGVGNDGTGVMRVARTPDLPTPAGLTTEPVDIPGPPTSAAIRGAGWAEAAVLRAAAIGVSEITSPEGAVAEAAFDGDGRLIVRVRCGDPLDDVVLRSYCTGAAHMALGWVRSEGISVDSAGEVHDLTIRSFGILRAKDTPEIDVEIDDEGGPPVNGGDAVFAAVALTAWRADGLAPRWPTRR